MGAETLDGTEADQQVSIAETERMMKIQEVVLEGGDRQAEVVGGCRDHRHYGLNNAAVAGAVRGTRLQRAVGVPQEATEPEAGASSRSWSK